MLRGSSGRTKLMMHCFPFPLSFIEILKIDYLVILDCNIDVGHNLIFNFCNYLILIFLCNFCYFRFRLFFPSFLVFLMLFSQIRVLYAFIVALGFLVAIGFLFTIYTHCSLQRQFSFEINKNTN